MGTAFKMRGAIAPAVVAPLRPAAGCRGPQRTPAHAEAQPAPQGTSATSVTSSGAAPAPPNAEGPCVPLPSPPGDEGGEQAAETYVGHRRFFDAVRERFAARS